MTISGGELLKRLRTSFPGAQLYPSFPYLKAHLFSERFVGLDEDDRETLVADSIGISVTNLRSVSDRLFIRFEFLDEHEEPATLASDHGSTWLSTFANNLSLASEDPNSSQTIHFYGFKGGQGRSTLLAFLAVELAHDGYSTLVVDLDAEAPSLDLVFGIQSTPLNSSLVGLRAGVAIRPLSAGIHHRGDGRVSILGFRPSDEEYDLDATALAFEASVYAPGHQELAARFRDEVANHFDIVLIDHRTGLGPTVPAWIRTIPGPIIVMDRLDGQCSRAVRDISRLWSGLPSPGILVSYSPPTMSTEAMREQRRGAAWRWLEALAAAKSQHADELLGAEDVEDHWLLWPDDNAFRRGLLPQRDEVGGATRDCITRLRELLNLEKQHTRPLVPVVLHPSGAADQGLLIVTDALRELQEPTTAKRFVFGRKGTGKTRLVHELALRKAGQPLVVAEDEGIGGISSQDPLLRDLVARAKKARNYEGVWWTLIVIALKGIDTSKERMESELRALKVVSNGSDAKKTPQTGVRRILLIDGLETMTQNREEARENIQALLNVCSTIENDKQLSSLVSLRIFLRADIARWGFENFEQQSYGKRIDLSWSAQTILNFVLSRLPNYSWIAKQFPDVTSYVQENENNIQQGSLSETDCLNQMLRIFPAKLGRLNLNTTTFLRTYFSDDPSGLQSYYPRVYDKFLEHINSSSKSLIDGRVSQDVIMTAHDEASADFLTQVRQELRFLVPLAERDLDRFIGSLKEKRTPFPRKQLASAIRNSLKLPQSEIDRTLEAMKEIGIFEQHPIRADHWRVGRLFKAALKMKYGKRGPAD